MRVPLLPGGNRARFKLWNKDSYSLKKILLPGSGMRLFAFRTRLHRHYGAVRDGDAPF